MSAQRVFGISMFACVVAACAPYGTTTAPRPLKPEDGPKASIRVGYSGGLVSRSLSAYFRTEENAFVLVGHLSGDGVIRVLYPSSPDQLGYIRGKKTNQTQTVAAHYDGAPALYSYTMSPYRSLSAMYDSYDGRGHGYVFIIASRRPLASSLVSDLGEWEEMSVADYSQSYDPRAAIRDFADLVSAGARYTLKFASSFATSHYDAYAARAWDCSLLSSFGFFSLSPWWNSPGWNSSSWNNLLGGLHSSSMNYCGEPAYRTYRTYAATNFVPTIIPSPPPTPGAPAPKLSRPGRRPLGEPGPASGPTRSATLTRGVATGRGLSGRPQFGERRTGPRTPTPTTESVRTATPQTGYGSRPSYDRPPSRRNESGSAETRGSASSGSSASTTTRTEPPTSSSSTERSAATRSESPRMTSPREARSPDKPNE